MDTRMKTKTPRLSFWKTATALGSFALGVAIPLQSAIALDDNILPSGGNVVGGSADLHYNGANRLDIHQTTNRVVIDWNKFDIGKNATTQFHQPNSGSLAVNRVVGPGQDPTKILGTLKANGTVMVLDRNGVIFGADSRVDVGGIIASTGQVDTAAIMGGNGPIEIMNATQGAIVQAGMMTIGEAGLAAFVAPTITNSGLIEAKLGRVVLASGEKATVDLYGDGLVELATDKPLQHAAISNSGTIHAEGGTVLMTASAAKDIVGDVINISGVVNASSATVKGGKIILEGANTKVSGTLDASGKKGGGEILIGGDYQGGGGTRTATNTTITSDAVIKASTTGTDGDGGKVIVWADNNTSFEGSIEARGGSSSGNGGLVETSGKKNLRVTGSVDASANNAAGKNGEWLLDPQNVRITNSAGASVPVGGGDYNPTGTDNPFVVLDSSISAALSAGNNVTITTYNPGQSQAGNIDIDNATILKDNGGDATLTFKADGRIYTTGTNSITSTAGKLNTIFWMDADNNGVTTNGAGINIMNTTITTNGGDFVAGGGADDGGVLHDAFGNILYTGVAGDGRPDSFAYSNDGHGFDAESFTLDTGDGDITIFGKAGSDTGWTIGVRLYDDITFNTHNGNVLIIGEGGTTPDQTADGIEAYADITSTGSGSITLSGKGGSSATNGSTGVYSGNTISARDGAITFIGRGGGVNGIGVEIYGDVISDGDSTITFMGQGTDANAYAIDMGTNQTFGGAQATGDQVWIGDKVWLDSSADIRTSGSITLKPLTNSLNINIGRTGVGLNLTDVMLNSLFAGTLMIGDKDNGTGDIIIDSWNLSSKTHHVEVYGNDITVQDTDGTATPGIQLGTGNLLMHAKDGADLGSITLNAAINKALAGHSKIDLRADENIVLSAANMIASNGGSFDIILNADRDADEDGAISLTNSTLTTNGGYFVAGGGSGTVDSDNDGIFGNGGTGADMVAVWGNATYKNGIDFNNSKLTTKAGQIILNGHGNNDSSLSDQNGIYLRSGSSLISETGAITLIGTGGNGDDTNIGIHLNGSGIQSEKGNILLKGNGGSSGLTGSDVNDGIRIIQTTAYIKSTGTGTDAAKITLEGHGGNGQNTNSGIAIYHATGAVESIMGDILIKGYGGTNGQANSIYGYGFYMFNQAQVKSTGSGANAAKITIEGYGSAGKSVNHGIFLSGYNSNLTKISSVDGNILLKGYGGDTSMTSGGASHGIIFSEAFGVESTGAANITLFAKGGTDSTNTTSVDISTNTDNANYRIGGAGMTGDITIEADTINLLSPVNFSTQRDILVKPRTASTTIGLGGGTGTLNLTDAELAMFNAGRTFIIGDSVNGTGDVNIDSWDLSGKTHHVEVYGNDITVQDTDGTATPGIQLGTGNLLMHAKDGADLGSITLNAAINKALAGHSKIDLRADENIVLSAANMIASNGGSFDIVLNADRDADQNGAVSMTNSTITTNGGYFVAGGGSGTVDSNGDNILGNGGTGADMVAAHGNATYTDGITISGGQINTGVGALALNGTGYAAADTGHDGISLLSGARLQSTSGNMRLIGRGGEGGTDFTRGILMAGASIIETQNGVLTLEGYGGQNTSGGDSIGVSMLGSADILVTDAGHIDITAVGGGGSFGAVGFKMETAGTSLVNTNGNIVVNATGGTPGDPWAYSDYGIYLSGVLVENTHGNITMTGTGTGSTLGFDNYGIFMDGSAVVQMLDDGDITMTGHGGQGNNADGFRMQNTDTAITNQNGAITLTGNNLYGNALGSEDGLILYIDARVEARGAGNLTLNGTTGLNDADSYGVRAMINGAISHTGSGDVIINAASNGGKDFVLNSSQLNANGNITLNTDAISIENGAAMATAQTLTITPRTATTTIGLGGGAGTLNLDDAELASISMNKFIIGDAVNGTGDVTIDSWDLSGTSYDTEIYGGKIIVGGAPYGLQNDSNNSLLLDASDSIDINSAINLDGALTLNAANSITVADADLTANGITADRSLTYDGTTGTTRILDAGSGILTLAGATAGNRNLTLIGDSMTLAGALTTGTGYNLNILPNTDGRDIMLGGGAGGLNLDDAELSYLQAGGLLTIGKQSTGTGNLTVNSAAFTSDVALYGGSTILNGLSSTGEILVASQGAGNDITLTHDVVSSAAGDAIILASADDFFNNAASAGNALRATNVNGRWLVYSERMDQNTRNGLMPHASEFGVSYPAVAAGAGNRFLYTSTVRPELTLTVNDDTVISGHAYNPAHAGYTITGGFLSGDTRNNIGLTGNLDYATSYVPGVTPASGNPHAGMITATGIGTLSSALGYSFNPVIGTGDLLVQGAPVSPPKPPVEINLPPLINYYANLNAITAHYPISINIIRQPASYVDASGNLLDGNIEGLINIEGYVNNLEPASGNYINVDADVSRSRIMADNASCLVTNGFNGGCFIF